MGFCNGLVVNYSLKVQIIANLLMSRNRHGKEQLLCSVRHEMEREENPKIVVLYQVCQNVFEHSCQYVGRFAPFQGLLDGTILASV